MQSIRNLRIMKHILEKYIGIAVTFIGMAAINPVQAATPSPTGSHVEWKNERNDTTRITHILIEEASQPRPGSLSRIGELFEGTPYGNGMLEGDEEKLRINLDSLDCTTFVETVAALALTARENRESWRDFLYNIERLRYRGGSEQGYASRLHYVSEWVLDNQSRGNLREVTGEMPGVRYMVKSLDYMTRHREAYPSLADSANFARMNSVEGGFSNYRYPYLKGNQMSAKKLRQIIRDGDIIALTTSTPGLDVSHLGIAVADSQDGEIHLLHASSKEGKVLTDPLTLAEYLRRNRTEGIRIIRLTE